MQYQIFARTAFFALCASLGLGAQDAPPVPEFNTALHFDVSPALRDIPPGPPSGLLRVKPILPHTANSRLAVRNQIDPALQSLAPRPLVATTPSLNFAGVGNGDYGFSPNSAPPDPNGAAGATQYVQWVNTAFAVFDKSTGAIKLGPIPGSTLWSGFGGGCQTNNDGDAVVQYDKAANRWVMTQFSVTTTPFLQCVAISTTSDATGTWYRYSFAQPNFNDYPKLGVWPDGYYMSFNMFNGNTFVGGRACAFERAAMLAGAAAKQICFQLSTAYGGLLPSDLDGSTPPPAGSPNYFLAFGTNVLQLWKFRADFTTPANSTFTGPTNIPVAAFTAACGGGGTCIPQAGTTQKLDSLADRLMYRLAYRNFGTNESLVVNHSVTAGTSVGVRWYELRSPNTAPTVYQQGTYAPDANYRWMGSIGMDKAGNIALGYSVSGGSMNPAIRYTGRLPGDPLGTLQAENTIINGGGSQIGGLSRWGDYSAMTIDPTDDCTFFFTSQYLKANGSFNWSTRIASFSFPSCTGITQVFTSIGVAPASASVAAGQTRQFTATALDQFGAPMASQPAFTWVVSGGGVISATGLFTAGATAGGPFAVTASSGGISGTASVTVTAPPVLTSITVSPATASVQAGRTLQFTAKGYDQSGVLISPQPAFTWSVSGGGSISASGLFTAGATAGGPFTVRASSGSVSGTASVTVTPAPPNFSLSVTPSTQTVLWGTTVTYTVTVIPTNGFNSPVTLSVVSGLPSGATATFSPNPATGVSTLTVTTSVGVRANTTLSIRGVSGSIVKGASTKLIITGT